MSGKNAKKERQPIKAAQAARINGINHVDILPAPDLQSYVAGFLAARGYDFVPMITIHENEVLVDLYYDAGDKGYYRITRYKIPEKNLTKPRAYSLAASLLSQLLQGIPQRTPSPMSEGQIRNIRDQLGGAMRDALSLEEWMGMLNELVETLSQFLRRKPFSVADAVLEGIKKLDEPEEPVVRLEDEKPDREAK